MVNLTTGMDQFGFLLTEGKEWYSPKEVGALVGRSDQYIRNLFENQKILGHLSNGRADKGCEKRRTYQIHRDCVILYLLETANYEPVDFMDRLVELLGHRSEEQLEHILELLEETIQAKNGLLAWS